MIIVGEFLILLLYLMLDVGSEQPQNLKAIVENLWEPPQFVIALGY